MAPAKNIFESNEPQTGARATESAHRKVELQAPQDLQYLIANVQRAAREKLDRHLPPDAAPEGEDAMRKRVEELVDEVCARALERYWDYEADAAGSTSEIRSMQRRIACQSTAWIRRRWKLSSQGRKKEKVSDAWVNIWKHAV